MDIYPLKGFGCHTPSKTHLFTTAGVIPAEGQADISIEFTPSKLSTCMMKVELSVSQFNFDPIVCTIVGSAVAGDIRQRELKARSQRMTRELSTNGNPARDPVIREVS